MELWIARDENGKLGIFPYIPKCNLNKTSNLHYWTCYNGMEIASNKFLEVTFDNSPQKVRLEIVKEEEV